MDFSYVNTNDLKELGQFDCESIYELVTHIAQEGKAEVETNSREWFVFNYGQYRIDCYLSGEFSQINEYDRLPEFGIEIPLKKFMKKSKYINYFTNGYGEMFNFDFDHVELVNVQWSVGRVYNLLLSLLEGDFYVDRSKWRPSIIYREASGYYKDYKGRFFRGTEVVSDLTSELKNGNFEQISLK